MEKPHTLLIKDLNNSFNCEEILRELQSYNVPDVSFIKVSEFKTKNSITKQIKLWIFLVQLSTRSVINNVYKIKYVQYQVIKWEKLKKNEITQCYKCQSIRHVARNCYMEYRCVNCKDNHEPGMCKINKN